MSNGFLEDVNGKKSSKRFWGSIVFSFGILFSVVLFVDSLLKGAVDASTALSIINMFLLVGGGLLGIGVVEKSIEVGSKKKK